MQRKSLGMDPGPGTMPSAEDPRIIRLEFCRQATSVVGLKERAHVGKLLGDPHSLWQYLIFLRGKNKSILLQTAPENQTALKTEKIVRWS